MAGTTEEKTAEEVVEEKEIQDEVTDEQIVDAEKDNPEKANLLKAKQSEQKKEHFPPEGSKRWKKLEWEMHESKRKTEDLEKRISEKDKDIELLRKHNEEIIKSINKENKQEEKNPVKTIQEAIRELRSKKAEAISNINYEEAFKIGEQIEDLMLEASQVNKKEVKEEAKKAIAEEEISDGVADYAMNHDWFLARFPDGTRNPKYDAIRVGAAEALERELRQDWKGSYKELLKEIDKKLVDRFDKTSTTEEKKKAPPIAGTTESSLTAASKVTLTDDQKRVAHRLFDRDSSEDAEKKYAEQLKAMGRVK